MQAVLFRVLLDLAGDPETEVPKWLADYTPHGLKHPINPVGVFPAIDPRAVGPEFDKLNRLLARKGS